MKLGTLVFWMKRIRRSFKPTGKPAMSRTLTFRRRLNLELLEAREVPATFYLTVPDALATTQPVYATMWAQLLETYQIPGGGTIAANSWVTLNSSGQYEAVPASGTNLAPFEQTSVGLNNQAFTYPDTQVQAAHVLFGIGSIPTIVVNSDGSVPEPTPASSPSKVYDFVEFTLKNNAQSVPVLTINTSMIDQFGYPIELRIDPEDIRTPDGVGVIPARDTVFTEYANYVQGTPFADATVDSFGNPITTRILSPKDIALTNPVQTPLVTSPTQPAGATPTYYYAITGNKTNNGVSTTVTANSPAGGGPGGTGSGPLYVPTQTTGFPSSTAGSNPFLIQVDAEILQVTDNTTTPGTWIVTHSQRGTTGSAHNTGAIVNLLVSTNLVGALPQGQLTMTVASSAGFPVATATNPILVQVDSEIVKVTDNSTTTWTIVRGQRGSSDVAHTFSASTPGYVTLMNETQVGNVLTSISTDPSTSSTQLSWTKVVGASTYNIYRGTVPVGGGIPTTWEQFSTFSQGNFTDTGSTTGAYPVNIAQIPFSALNTYLDSPIGTLFTGYTAASPLLLTATDGSSNGYTYYFSGTSVTYGAGPGQIAPTAQIPTGNKALQFNLTQVLDQFGNVVPSPSISLGTLFYVYQPFFNTNTYDSANPAPPTWLNTVAYGNTNNISASGMAFSASGVFASKAFQPIPAGVPVADTTAAQELLGSLENQIVAAITRGIATGSGALDPFYWSYTPTQTKPTILPTGGTFPSLAPGGGPPVTYYYVITAENPVGGGPTAGETTASLPFTATPTGTESVQLNWKPLDPSLATYFKIYRSTSPDGPTQLIGTTTPANTKATPVISFTDTGIAGSNASPPAYYPTAAGSAPSDLSAAFWHQGAISKQGLAYASPYDDQGGRSSTISTTNPVSFSLALGDSKATTNPVAGIVPPNAIRVDSPSSFTGTIGNANPQETYTTSWLVTNSSGTAIATGTGTTLTVSFPSKGSYTVFFTVTDSHGASDTATTTVSANNVDITTSSPNEYFVADLYQIILGRQADQEGLNAWLTLLNNGVSRQQIALGIEHSPESQGRFIEQLYNDILQRNADPEGLANFVALLNNGTTIEGIKALFYGSDEYFERICGSNNDVYLNNLYLGILGRNIDSAGQTTLSQKLASGTNRTDVALAVLTSLEAYQDLIRGYYLTYLNREPDDFGFNIWVNALRNGMRDEVVLANFLGSNEFFDAL